MSIGYAIVYGSIEEYVVESVKYEHGSYDPDIDYVVWEDSRGCTHVTETEEFITGTRKELMDIISREYREMKVRVDEAIAKFNYPKKDMRNEIIRFLIEDGCSLEELNEELIEDVYRGTCRACHCNANFQDAYMDYMH